MVYIIPPGFELLCQWFEVLPIFLHQGSTLVGLDGDMLEAQAFAYLAVRVLRGLPTSAPSTTGCHQPVCGGRISYP